MIPAAPPAAAPAATPPPAVTPSATDPNSPDAWVLSEGVLGTGPKPEWFKGDKYKSVAAQAEAYVALEKRFGTFVGAPADGKYDSKLPEGVGAELVGDHPLLGTFGEWAKTNALSQKGYTELLGLLGQYESQHFVDQNQVKAELGENADARLNSIVQWGAANLGAEGYQTLRAALVPSAQTAAVIKVIEATIAKTRQTPMPKPGDDVPAAGLQNAHAELDKLQAERTADGKQRYFTDPKFRAEIEAKRAKLFQPAA